MEDHESMDRERAYCARSFLLILDDEGGPPLGGNKILAIAWSVQEGRKEIQDGLEVLGYKR